MRQIKRSLILFGEGKTEAVFLNHLYRSYRDQLPDTKINTDWGRGGSPDCVAERLIRSHLNLKQNDGALLLLDADVKISPSLKGTLAQHTVQLVISEPLSLEGLFLQLLDDSGPQTGKGNAATVKQYFQAKYLKTDRKTEYVAKLKQACPKLFPAALIDAKRKQSSCINEILKFMGV